MPYVSKEARRLNSSRWYTANRERHIARVLARRAAAAQGIQLQQRAVDAGAALPEAFEERHAIAVALLRQRNPALWDTQREELRQEAAVLALTYHHFGDLSRAAGRAAWKMKGQYEPSTSWNMDE